MCAGGNADGRTVENGTGGARVGDAIASIGPSPAVTLAVGDVGAGERGGDMSARDAGIACRDGTDARPGAANVDLPTVTNVALASIPHDEVLRYLGRRRQRLDDELVGRIDAACARVLALARPRAALRSFAVETRGVAVDGTPELALRDSALVLRGTSVNRLLASATEVVVMAVTLGMGVERELSRLSLAGNALDQLLFDAAATAAVECATDAANALVSAKAAAHGLVTTRRYSPGYGDLPLDCQSTLLASVDATRRLGLTLTTSNLLVPTKSVTAVMGVEAADND